MCVVFGACMIHKKEERERKSGKGCKRAPFFKEISTPAPLYLRDDLSLSLFGFVCLGGWKVKSK